MVLELLRKLVDIESPSGQEDEIIEYILEFIHHYGWDTETHESHGVENVLVNPQADYWVATHMDTVDIKREFHFDGVYAYGTGACDAKGSLAAMLTALRKLYELNIGFAFLSDEEEGGKGSRLIMKEYRPETVVVMEPTSLNIATQQYGSLEVEIGVTGSPAHGSFFDHENAIEKALDMVGEIKNITSEFSIQEMKGGDNEFLIPDYCMLRIEFLFPPGVDVSSYRERIENIAEEYGAIEIIEEHEGFIADKCPLLERAMQNVGLEVNYSQMLSWTDAVNFKQGGSKAIIWGPGDMRMCHTHEERISVEEIQSAVDVIISLNEQL